MKRTFVSFDVFDTCLIRRCGRPEKIWDLMAERLFDKDDSRGRMSFVGNRSIVEEKLRNLGNVHATLDDIYTELRTEQWGFCKERLMQLEMDVEEQELFPNPEIVKLVEDYRSKDFTIAFISDMYLPSTFLRKILQKHGFCKEFDCVFVSAECKASKHDGLLFEYCFKQTGTKAKQWSHYGDNKRSDFYVPKSKGVKANWVSNTDFTDEEKRWLNDARFYPHKHEIELWAGICRLTRIQNERSDYATMAVNFIASNYVPYVFWIFETAQRKGIKKLFFLGRDGHIFYEIAKQIREKYPDIDISYLKVSRKSIYSCMFIEGSDFELNATIGNARSVKDALFQIGFDYNELSEATREKFLVKDKLSERKKEMFFKSLKKYDLKTLMTESRKKRKLLLEYLLQENVLCNERTALVDLGWYGSSRCNLNYILRKSDYKALPTFYWGVCDFMTYGEKDDELFIFQRQYNILKKNTPTVSVFMEHYASMNSDGSTIGYARRNDRVVPVEDNQCLNNRKWQEINEHFCSIVADLSGKMFERESFRNIFLCCGLKNLESMLEEPSKETMRFFKNLKIENFNETSCFFCRLDLKNVIALLVWGTTIKPVWLKPSIQRTFGFLSPAFERLYRYSSKTTLAMKFRLWWDGRK